MNTMRKMMELIKKHDEILAMIEHYNNPTQNVENKSVEQPKKSKSYSMFNVPGDQKEFINKAMKKGE